MRCTTSIFHYTEGQVLVGFGCWLHCRIGIGEGDAPRLILAPCWEAPRCCAKASLFSERAVGMQARKESLLLSDVHLCWENKLASRSNGSNLPWPLQGHPHLSSLEKRVSLLDSSSRVLELMNWCDMTVQLQLQKNQEEWQIFFQDTLACSNIYLACWSINVSFAAVTDFLI